MKLKYLLFALLAVGAQPSLAAEPAVGLGENVIESAAAVAAVRRQELQRVADARRSQSESRREHARCSPGDQGADQGNEAALPCCRAAGLR